MGNLSDTPRKGGEASTLASSLRERDQRLEALKCVVDHLGHEFNNMLVPLLGYATLLKDEIPVGSLGEGYLSKILATTRQSEAAIGRILTVVRPKRRFSPAEKDLDVIVSRLLAAWKSALRTGVGIEVLHEIEPCRCVFDEDLITHALGELLSNARFALAFGGTLKVSLRRASAPAGTALAGLSTEVIELSVADNGLGMTEQVLHRCCEPFFSTRQRGQASGLGLTAVQSIASLHGGLMEIQSDERGTSVRIWIPFSAVKEESTTPSAYNRLPGTVLYADPDPVGREMAKAVLLPAAEAVVVAKDEGELIRLLDRCAAKLAVALLSDELSPIGPGRIHDGLRARAKTLPVVWFGVQNEAALGKLIPERLVYLRKPFSPTALVEAARRQIG